MKSISARFVVQRGIHGYLAMAPLLFALVLVGCAEDGNENGADEPDQQTEPAESSTPAQIPDELSGRLLYSRFDESTHTFLSTHTSDPDGSHEVELPLPGPEGGGRWSRDGKHIAVMTLLDDGRIGTAIIQPDGTVERVLAIPDPTLNLVCTVWSPDDQRLACEGWDDAKAARTGIYTVRSSDGGELIRLTQPGDGMVDFPGDWSPDGSVLLLKRTVEESPGPLFVVPTDGGDTSQLGTELVEDPGRYSPDGTAILTSARGQIVLLDADGTVTLEFGDASRFDFGPVWSPDGAHIAYSGGLTGPFADIFVARADGTHERQITETPDNEILVEWGRG
jgi:Tol biopolymer transport system component